MNGIRIARPGFEDRSRPGFCTRSTRLLALLLLLGFLAEAGASDTPVGFEPSECWGPVDEAARIDCGWVIVPEDWNSPDGQVIKLPVAVFSALKADASLSPVVYLAGGPAVSPLGANGKYLNGWRWFADNRFPGRTLVVFDQRGIGLGIPKLECPEMTDSTLWWPVLQSPDQQRDVPGELHAAYRSCMARHLDSGRRLHAFNTRQSARDVEALRRALEFDKMILFGRSYGTRLALTVMRHYPDHIEAAILDSVYPPQVRATWNDADALGAVLDRLFLACAADADCNDAYPDLRGRFLRALAQLKSEPVTIEITNLKGFDPLYARVDHRVFVAVLREEMYHLARLPNLPMLISGVAKGEYWRLKQHVENAVYGYGTSGFTIGANLAVDCNDDAGVGENRIRSLSTGEHAYLNDYVTWFEGYSFCEFWPISPDSQNRDPVASDIPSLLLAGGLDPSTTVEQAEIAAETLGTSHLFVFPAYGHGQLRSNPCGWEVVDRFLEDPVRRPDPACLASPRKAAFITAGGS